MKFNTFSAGVENKKKMTVKVTGNQAIDVLRLQTILKLQFK